MASCFAFSAVLFTPGLDVSTIREFMELRISLGNFFLFSAFAALWHPLFSAFGLYEDSLLSNAYRKAVDVLKATSIGTCAIVALAVPFKISFVDVQFTLIFWTSVSFLSFCSRLIARALLVRYNSQEDHVRRILIIGANTRSVRLAQRIETEQELGCRLIGFVDDQPYVRRTSKSLATTWLPNTGTVILPLLAASRSRSRAAFARQENSLSCKA